MEIRPLTADDLDAVLDNRRRAFGIIPSGDLEDWRAQVVPVLEAGRYLGVADGPRLIATSRINDFTQWWHGRPISMGGVASVTVAPEDRGRGVGRMLLRATVDRCAELGHPVSALYPAATRVYRSLGWEHAGALHRATFPAEALRAIGPAERSPVRRMGPGDAAEVIEIMGRVHAGARASGPICWDEPTWRLWLEEEDDFLYLADDGFVIYRWDGDDIEVDALLAGSEATARTLWSLIGSSSSIATSVRAIVAPDDPVFWLIGERKKDEVTQTRWMFRVVDLPAAVAGRGFPDGVTLDTVVRVEDPHRPANSGAWRLSVRGGAGEARPAEAPPGSVPVLTAGGFSALFAGVPAATLHRSGALTVPSGTASPDATGVTGAPDAAGAADVAGVLGVLETAFRATPYMLDSF
ncbi:enhanced intracellular survival protein Eis [Streptosporangium sp. NPDC050855]|uniref:enhanced intracellular survival protein Eis n=1 Tax=Streptosporangium sp. NPDC050855 TaxID=3366194 RepID=UPI0037B83DFF